MLRKIMLLAAACLLLGGVSTLSAKERCSVPKPRKWLKIERDFDRGLQAALAAKLKIDAQTTAEPQIKAWLKSKGVKKVEVTQEFFQESERFFRAFCTLEAFLEKDPPEEEAQVIRRELIELASNFGRLERAVRSGSGLVLPSGRPELSGDTSAPGQSSDDVDLPVLSWPGVVDSFDSSDSDWYMGSVAADGEVEGWTRRIVGGRYRWDMVFSASWLKYSLSPHGSAADFFASVDVVFSANSGEDVTAGLVFGHVGELLSESREHYELHIAPNEEWALSHARGLSNDFLRGPSKPSQLIIDIQQPVNVGVLVEDGYMRFYLNGVQVGDWREPNFNGGDVGLFVGASAGSVAVEFDQFRLSKKPRL